MNPTPKTRAEAQAASQEPRDARDVRDANAPGYQLAYPARDANAVAHTSAVYVLTRAEAHQYNGPNRVKFVESLALRFGAYSGEGITVTSVRTPTGQAVGDFASAKAEPTQTYPQNVETLYTSNIDPNSLPSRSRNVVYPALKVGDKDYDPNEPRRFLIEGEPGYPGYIATGPVLPTPPSGYRNALPGESGYPGLVPAEVLTETERDAGYRNEPMTSAEKAQANRDAEIAAARR